MTNACLLMTYNVASEYKYTKPRKYYCTNSPSIYTLVIQEIVGTVEIIPTYLPDYIPQIIVDNSFTILRRVDVIILATKHK